MLESSPSFHLRVYLSVPVCMPNAETKPAGLGAHRRAHLYCNPVLIQGQDLAHSVRSELREQHRGGGPIAGEGLVGNERVRNIRCPQFNGRLARGQRVRLRKEVAHQLVVVGYHLTLQCVHT